MKIFLIYLVLIMSHSVSYSQRYSHKKIRFWDRETGERAIAKINPFRVRTLYGYTASSIEYDRALLPIIGEFYNNTLPGLIKDLPEPIGRYLYDIPKLEGLAHRLNHKWDFVISIKSEWPGFFGEVRSHSGRYSNSGSILNPSNISKIFSPKKYYEIVLDNFAENSGINIGFDASIGVKPFELISGFHDLSFDLSRKSKILISESIAYNYGIDFTKKAGAELFSNNIDYESWVRERIPGFIQNQFDIAKLAGSIAKNIEHSIPAYIFGIPTDESIRFSCEVKYQLRGKNRIFECYVLPEFTKSINGYANTNSYSLFFGIAIRNK